ncbi:11947_t:CDS:2, partial [Ambispora gerdemannii]
TDKRFPVDINTGKVTVKLVSTNSPLTSQETTCNDKQKTFSNVGSHELRLWKVKIPTSKETRSNNKSHTKIEIKQQLSGEELIPDDEVYKIFPAEPPEEHITSLFSYLSYNGCDTWSKMQIKLFGMLTALYDKLNPYEMTRSKIRGVNAWTMLLLTSPKACGFFASMFGALLKGSCLCRINISDDPDKLYFHPSTSQSGEPAGGSQTMV